MKRTGIFALAGACALGVTALVGGVGYASALDVAEQAGATIDVPGVSTVDKTSEEVAKATTLDKNKSTPTPEPTDPATEPPPRRNDTLYNWKELVQAGFPFIKSAVLTDPATADEARTLLPRRYLEGEDTVGDGHRGSAGSR